MNEKKIMAVMGLAAPRRYDHFIKVTADRRCVWGLWSDGWALSQDNAGAFAFPVWPEKVYAELYAIDEWSDYEAREIDLDDVFDWFLPDLRADGTMLAVFPVRGLGGIMPDLDFVESDLRTELSRIE